MDMETRTALILRTGVALCILFVAVGVALIFMNSGGGGFSLVQIASSASTVNSSNIGIAQIVSGLFGLDGLSFIFVGIIILIATPIARVLFSIFAFSIERNWLYVVITLIVFINLMVAIFIVPMLIAH